MVGWLRSLGGNRARDYVLDRPYRRMGWMADRRMRSPGGPGYRGLRRFEHGRRRLFRRRRRETENLHVGEEIQVFARWASKLMTTADA